MTKLTVWKRNQVRKTLVSRAFDEKEKALELKGQELVRKMLYEHIKDHAKAWKTIPKTWLQKCSSYHLTISGFGNRWEWIPMGDDFYAPVDFTQNQEDVQFGHPLFYEVKGYIIERDNLKKERHELEVQIDGILNAHNTEKQLIDTWPELEPFFTKEVVVKNVPMVILPELNRKLGLPVKEDELEDV